MRFLVELRDPQSAEKVLWALLVPLLDLPELFNKFRSLFDNLGRRILERPRFDIPDKRFAEEFTVWLDLYLASQVPMDDEQLLRCSEAESDILGDVRVLLLPVFLGITSDHLLRREQIGTLVIEENQIASV